MQVSEVTVPVLDHPVRHLSLDFHNVSLESVSFEKEGTVYLSDTKVALGIEKMMS